MWGQKTIGATRAETKATRGDTQYGDASGSLTAHNARSRVNFSVPPCASPPPSSPLASCILLLSLSPSTSPLLTIHLTLPVSESSRDSPYITRGDDTFNCTLPRSRESNKFARFQSDRRIPVQPTTAFPRDYCFSFSPLSPSFSFSCSLYYRHE